MNLLIVDDSLIVIAKLQELLKEIETIQAITTASTYQESITCLKNNTHDVAVIDIQLPDASGIELLRHIKQNHPRIIVIMFSNQSNSYYRGYCKQLGAEYFLDKSNEFQQIVPLLVTLADK